jgi:hypothetical protein
MKLDRSLFLVLTGTLAGACQIYVDDPAPKTAAQPPPGAPTPPPAAAQPGAPPPAAPAPPAPPRKVAVEVHTAPAHGGAAPAPTPAPAACLDANATTVPDCAGMKAPDTTCAPFPFPSQRCAAYKAYFSAKVAASAVSCMNGLSSKQVCDATFAYNCGKTALAQACPDPQVGQLCAIAATSCKSTPAECTSLLSGLNDQGKQQVAQCVSQGCQFGLYSCIEGLSSTTGGAHGK